jgi:hypothetical protein
MPKRDSRPTVELSLIDPTGRVQPHIGGHDSIPKSRYGEIVELPDRPDRSEVLAIEICDPSPGTYSLKIKETGAQPYRVSVTGVAPNRGDTQSLKHNSENGRIRNYHFTFWIDKNDAHVQWLDEVGRPADPRFPMEIGEW